MRVMKDSGIAWIGEIPEEWKVSTIKREYHFQTGWTPDTTHEDYFLGGNIWVNISDLKSATTYDSEKHISNEAVQSSSMNISPKGSLMYAFKLSVGAVSFCGRDMYTNEAIATFLPGKNSLRFLYYMAPIFIIKNANENIYGAKLLNQRLIRNAKIIIPPIAEQERIADYLDRKCSQIDAIIARQQEVIEKLKAYKLSVITEAVTKGLNPHVPMKDSGVEWIGEIPEHWKIGKLCFFTVRIGDGLHGTPEFDDKGEYYFINGNNLGATYITIKENTKTVALSEYNKYFIALDENTLLISLNGTIGSVSQYHGEQIILGKSAGYIIIDSCRDLTLDYLRFYLQSKSVKTLFELSFAGTTINNLSLETLRNLPVCIMTSEEQLQISKVLDKKCLEIESTIQKKQILIERLAGYKKSLIYEVVTGKKEV